MIARTPGAAPVAAALPRHVAIIMDGNRRWAATNGLPAIEGHRRGMLALRSTIAAAAAAGIEILTVYAFSEENWERDAAEVAGLLEIGAAFARREAAALARAGVRVRVIGRGDRIPSALRAAFAALERRTAAGQRLGLNLAVDYGSRREVCEAMRALARDVACGRLDPDEIADDDVAGRLWTAGQPDPDLVIRTGGELRLSNFLLYQCAYAELWSTPTPWPAFDAGTLREALAAYAGRQRRFGR